MSDKNTELANRLVALGILKQWPRAEYSIECSDGRIIGSAEKMCNDGRVMLALVVMLRKRGYSFLLHSMPDRKALMTVSSPLPNQKKWASQIVGDDDCPVIIEACCEALENGQ